MEEMERDKHHIYAFSDRAIFDKLRTQSRRRLFVVAANHYTVALTNLLTCRPYKSKVCPCDDIANRYFHGCSGYVPDRNKPFQPVIVTQAIGNARV